MPACLLHLGRLDPRAALAVEEAVFEYLRGCPGAPGTVYIVWRTLPAIVVGRTAEPCAEVDCGALRARAVPLLRRHTGGGAVFHDEGNLVFAVVARREGRPSVDEVYNRGVNEVLAALSTLGVRAWVENEGDVVVDGWKVAGSAARASRGAWLYHAVLLVESGMELLRLLKPPTWRVERGLVTPAKYRPRPLRRLARVTYEEVEWALLGRAVSAGAKPCRATGDLAGLASHLYTAKYSRDEWNWRGRAPPSPRPPCGGRLEVLG